MAVIGNQTDVNIVSGGGSGLGSPLNIGVIVSSSSSSYTVPANRIAHVRAWNSGGTTAILRISTSGTPQLSTIPPLTASDEYKIGAGVTLTMDSGQNGTYRGWMGYTLA